MLPHIAPQQGRQGQGAVLVGGLADGEPPVFIRNQPGPARTELAQGRGAQGGFQALLVYNLIEF